MSKIYSQGGHNMYHPHSKPETTSHALLGAIVMWVVIIATALVVCGAYEVVARFVYTLTHIFGG